LHVAGPPNPQLNATQLIVADVSGNNAVTSFDAAMIAKFVAGPPYAVPGIGATATWRFTPVSRNYASVTGSITGENYTAVLMGEVSGNWTDSSPSRSAFGRNGPERIAAVTAPHLVTQANEEILIPIAVQGVAGKDVISY